MKKLLFIFIDLLLSFSVLAEKLEGKVTRVYDGDTLTLLTPERETIKIRLAEIDSPEMKQPYGLESKIALSDLVLNKDITARSKPTDRYGRKVANIYVNEVWVNSELVRQGFAWVYKKYSTDPRLPLLEDEAKETGKGL